MTYTDKLKDPRWQQKRLEILQRDDFACRQCKDKTTSLHVQHIVYARRLDPWKYHNDNLVTLCEHCHLEIENYTRKEFAIDYYDISIRKVIYPDGSRLMLIGYEIETDDKPMYSLDLNLYDSSGGLIRRLNQDLTRLPQLLQEIVSYILI